MIIEDIRILNVRSANRIHALPGKTTYRNNRECWGLMIKKMGETRYTGMNGETVISDINHVCLLPQGSSYSWTTSGGDCFGIEFDAEAKHLFPLSFSITNSETVLTLFYKLENALFESDSSSQFKAISYLYSIFVLMLDKTKKYELVSKKVLIEGAVNELMCKFSDPSLSVAKLAATAGISEAYFRRIYNEIYGVSPMQTLMDLRMKKAAELLQSDYNSINSIAEAVGYQSIYNFSKMFRRYYGVSPTKYKPN